MQIHNILTLAQRARSIDALDAIVTNLPGCRSARSIDALDAIVTNLPGCRSAPPPSPDQLLFTPENGEADVETLRVRLRSYEMRVYVAIRLGGMGWPAAGHSIAAEIHASS